MGKIKLVSLPYDSGRKDQRMGSGPVHLLENGIVESLTTHENEVEISNVLLPEDFHSEGTALVELQRRAVPLLQEALLNNYRILLLSGNCGPAAMSAVSALGRRRTGVIWFDAHADFNTPETSPSGFLDGMALSILTGHCWPVLAARFDNFEPVLEENVLLIGIRDLDSAEANALKRSGITQVPPNRLDLLEPAIESLAARVDRLYVHLDIDVLDEAEGRANTYAGPGGLSADALYAALKLSCRGAPVRAASITAYDPACDVNGKVLNVIKNAATILTS